MKVSTIKFQLKQIGCVDHDRSTQKIQWWSKQDTINKKQHPKGCVHRLGNEQKRRNTNEYSKFGK